MKLNKSAQQKVVVLKATIDPFLFKAFEFGGLSFLSGLLGLVGLVAMIYMYKVAAVSYEIHINVIQNGTQMLLEASLGHAASVHREIFDTLFELFKANHLNHEQQVIALKALMNNIIEYRDTQAISELEGKKLLQVANELRRLYERELRIEELINEVLQTNNKKSKGGWID